MKNKMKDWQKTMVSALLATVMMVLLLPTLSTEAEAAEVNSKFISIRDNGHENCILSMDTIKITQGLHYDAIDLGGKDTGRDWLYSPVSCRVTYVYTSGTNTVFFESLDKVNLPGYDEPQYIIFMAIHMDDLSRFKVGDVYRQGEKLYREGNHGRYSEGNHIHLAVGLGRSKTPETGSADWYKNSAGEWVIRNHIPANKALYLPKPTACNVVRTAGLKWTQIKDYTEERCCMLGKVTKVNSSKTAPMHNYPESAGAVVSRMQKGETVLLTGKVTNVKGNTWYRTADNAFIYSDYVTVDEMATSGIALAHLTFKNGGTYSFKCGGKTLYATGTANGDSLKLGSATGAKTQFKLTFGSDGYWTAASSLKNSAVINAYSDNPTSGCKATVYKKLSTPTQGLVFQKADLLGTGFVIRLASTPQLVLTAKGSAVQFVTYEKGNQNQIWKID